jgi:hypothetical protein
MITPKPSETYRNLFQLVSLQQAAKQHRNQRNHSLKGEAFWFRPSLARAAPSTVLAARVSGFAPLTLRFAWTLCCDMNDT